MRSRFSIATTSPPRPAARSALRWTRKSPRWPLKTTGRLTAVKRESEPTLLAGIIFIVPKIGPLKMVAIKDPTQATEADYLHSVVLSAAALRQGSPALLRRPPAFATANAISKSTRPRSHRAAAPPMPRRPNCAPRPRPAPSTAQSRSRHRARSAARRLFAHRLHLRRSAAPPHADARAAHPPGIKEDIQAYYADPARPSPQRRIHPHGHRCRPTW